jgi:hypothetical protein
MKPLIAAILGTVLAGCAESPTPTASTGIPNYPYVRYDSNRHVDASAANSPFRMWTTAQLQQRRRDLYATVEYRESRRHGIPEYTYRGQPLPQQDEIFAIENELKRRYQAGDRAAELTRPIPGTSHI